MEAASVKAAVDRVNTFGRPTITFSSFRTYRLATERDTVCLHGHSVGQQRQASSALVNDDAFSLHARRKGGVRPVRPAKTSQREKR